MNTKTLVAALFGSTALVVSATGALYAATGSDGHDTGAGTAAMVAEAPISLRDAIATAEQESMGRVIEAEAEDEDGRLVYEVTTVADGQLHEVLIDPQGGGVLETAAVGVAELPRNTAVEIEMTVAVRD